MVQIHNPDRAEQLSQLIPEELARGRHLVLWLQEGEVVLAGSLAGTSKSTSSPEVVSTFRTGCRAYEAGLFEARAQYPCPATK